MPASSGDWSTFPAIEDLFLDDGSGVMPGRTWIIAPDRDSLEKRWNQLKAVAHDEMDEWFMPHMAGAELGDRHSAKILNDSLDGFPVRLTSLAEDKEPMIPPVQYGYRSFDRQWILPDKRLINRPNPDLWKTRSNHQIFATVLSRTSPTNGPAITFTASIPDMDHYRGSFGGRVFPMWSDNSASTSNVKESLIQFLKQKTGLSVISEDLFSYIAGIASNPAYTARFQPDLSTPGLRIPITADPALFEEATAVGRRILWLHTFGERMSDPAAGRPSGPPRLPPGQAPSISLEGRISGKPEDFPDSIGYDAAKHRLLVGHGFIDNVPPAVWRYEVSGKQVLLQWFSYRRKNRERPIIGDRRPPSKLGDIQPDHWLPEYTTELLNVLNVLALLVELEPAQADLLERICTGPLLSKDALEAAGALAVPPKPEKLKKAKKDLPQLF